MSRLDRHISAVRTRLTLHELIQGAVWALLILACGAVVAILLDRAVGFGALVSRGAIIGAGCAAIIGVILFAILRRPSAHSAAVAIDQRLNLKEKFSTALYIRPSTDPFAQAAVRDAENTADQIQLHKQFPMPAPQRLNAACIAILVAALAYFFIPGNWDLFGRKVAQHKTIEKQQAQVAAQTEVQQALTAASAMPPDVKNSPEMKQLVADLSDLHNQHEISDTAAAHRKTIATLQAVNQAVAQAQEKERVRLVDQKRFFHNLNTGSADNTPLAKAEQELKSGNTEQATEDLANAGKNFKNMSGADQQATQEQMQQLADKLKDLANDKQLQKNLQDQIQQMGGSQQMAKKMTDEMQQAANGDQQAMQDLKKDAQQLQQGMNNGQGPTPEQQKQISDAINQMQQQMNSQSQANGMSQAAQQMADAMKQMQQQNQQQANAGNPQTQPGGQQNAGQQNAGQQNAGQSPQNSGQQAKGGQNQQPGQAPGQQPGQDPGQQQANAGGQQPGQGPGQQPGQGPGQQQTNAGQQPGQGPGQQPGQGPGQQQANAGGQQPGQGSGQPGNSSQGSQGQNSSGSGMNVQAGSGSQTMQGTGSAGQMPGAAPQGGQGGQQAMNQAIQNMQASQQAANTAAAQQQNVMNGNGNGQQPGGNGQQPQPGGQGQFAQANQQQPQNGGGQGQFGIGAGGNTGKAVVPFQVKKEVDADARDPNGRVLASTLVEDNHPDIGKSSLKTSEMLQTAEKQTADEVDPEHASGPSRKAAEKYFKTVEEAFQK